MDMVQLGNTDLKVSRLGVGLVEIGLQLTENNKDQAYDLLNTALEGGINFFDTAECYGISEDLIGEALSDKRDKFILATKAGHPSYGTEGVRWQVDTIKKSIDRSLKRLKTDYVDILQMHAYDIFGEPPDEVVQVFLDAKRDGKTRYIGYSQENEEAVWAIKSGLFDTIQTAFNMMDQRALFEILDEASKAGMGVIAKRPIGNGMWGRAFKKSDHYEDTVAKSLRVRAEKIQSLGPIKTEPENHILAALGFVLHHPQIHTAIVGSRNPKHVKSNIDMVNEQLPIASEYVEELHKRYEIVGSHWRSID
ncbi:MAG: hypothetical protein DK302_001291 [Chloroflexi bacterium]|jgi:aryl-alcohol dehydrogenase-like predicted oxidoreductase|nr:MAG: hypothetical protein DK302_001291 [Chloroflexota bacterium]